MRELKFRAWSEETKSFEYFDLYEGTECGLTNLQIWARNNQIEQYTGLKDKNGKEIYEGDIVKFDDIDSEAEVSKPAEVIMEYGAFLTKCADGELYILEDGTPVVLGLIKNELYQVIGNIHENKELLEDKK